MTDFNENWQLGQHGVVAEQNHISHYLNRFRSVEMFQAAGDGLTDDTGHLQDALDVVPNLYFPGPATYLIDATVGLQPQSYQHILLHPQAVIQVMPTAATGYHAFLLDTVTHVTIRGGQISGDRATHLGSTGEFGMCITMTGASHILLEDMTIRDCWGDGLYITGDCEDIHLQRVISDHNRRQAMSVTSIDRLAVTDCSFQNSDGTSPKSGVDLEPNAGETVQNVVLTRCLFKGNSEYGLVMGVQNGTIKRIQLVNCRSEANRRGYYLNRVTQIQFSECVGYDNTLQAFWLGHTDDILLTGLHASGNGHAAIALGGAAGLDCTHVMIAHSSLTSNLYGIYVYPQADGVTLIGNRMSNNSTVNLFIDAAAQNVINLGNYAP